MEVAIYPDRALETSAIQFHFVEGYYVEDEGPHVRIVFYEKRRGLLMLKDFGVVYTKEAFRAACVATLPLALEAAREARGLFSVN